MAALPNTGSAIPPPPGVTPDFGAYSPGDRKAWLAATVVMLVVPTMFVALRFAVKKLDPRTWTAADYICIVAWALNCGMSGIAFDLLDHGVGYEGWNVSPAEFSYFAKMLNNQVIVYMPAMLCTKAAIFLQLYQIFCVGNARLRKTILIGAICVNAVFFMIMFWITIFSCNPREKYWNPSLPGSCLDTQHLFIATAVINVSDYLVVLVLPVTWIWRLNLRFKRKLAISGTFAATIFSLICSLVRLADTITHATSPNITIALIPVSLWACAEVASGVVVCCLPLVPIFIRMNFRNGNKDDVDRLNAENAAKAVRGWRGKYISDESLLLTTNNTKIETTISSTANEKSRAISETNQSNWDASSTLNVPENIILRSVDVQMASQHI